MPSAREVASLFATINLTDNLTGGLSTASNGLTNFGNQLSNLGTQVAGLGLSLTALTAPFTAFAIDGVEAASNFESALVDIGVRAGLTDEQLDLVREKALQLGQDTQFSAGQAAAAFLDLLTSGQSLEEAMITIDQVLLGAAAGGESLGTTADALTDIMAAFGLEASDANAILEALTDASGSSSATFADLVAGFQNVGGVASNFGISVDETAAILALFAENGIKGSEAGTQLRSMLNNMSRDTPEVVALWESLGISMFDAMGNARPFGDVLEELRIALASMSDEDRIATLQTLGGAFGQMGLGALTSGGSMQDMLTAMSQAGDASEIAEARMGTFAGSMDFLKGSIETLQIEVMTPFMNNVLKPLVGMIGDVVNSVTNWARENPELAQTIITIVAAIAGLGAALIPIGGAMIALGPVFGAVSTGLRVMGTAIGALTSPLGLVTAGIIGIGLAYKTNFMGFRDTVDNVVVPALSAAGTTARQLAVISLGATAQAGANAKSLWGQIVQIAEGVWKSISTTFKLLIAVIVGAVAQAGKNAKLLWGQIKDIAEAMWGRIVSIAEELWGKVSPHIKSFTKGLEGAFNWIKTNIIDPLVAAIEGIVDVAAEIAAEAGNIIGGIGNFIQDPLGHIGDGIGNIGQGIGSVLGLAGGGEFGPGQRKLVGENGPEIITSGVGGNVTPNHELGRGGMLDGVVINIYANSQAEGAAAGRGLRPELERLLRG